MSDLYRVKWPRAGDDTPYSQNEQDAMLYLHHAIEKAKACGVLVPVEQRETKLYDKLWYCEKGFLLDYGCRHDGRWIEKVMVSDE